MLEMPYLKHRFILNDIPILDAEQNRSIQSNLVAIFFDYSPAGDTYSPDGTLVRASHSLLLNVEEPINNGMIGVLDAFRNHKGLFDITVDNITGDLTTIKRTIYHNCSFKSYKYRLDYGVSETCNYPLWFNVGYVTEKGLKSSTTN